MSKAVPKSTALVEEEGSHARGQPHDRGRRQVDLTVDDQESHRERHDNLLNRQDEQVDLVAHAQVVGRQQAVDQEDRAQDDDQ